MSMITFGNRLREVMKSERKTVEDLKNYFNFKSNATIYTWLNDKFLPSGINLIKLADYFKLSIDYLLCRTENDETIQLKPLPPFDEQLKFVIAHQKSSQYKLLKDKVISRGHLNSWLKNKNIPSTENMIKLADYLGVSIDFLVGRG